jgi:hypothetical protein
MLAFLLGECHHTAVLIHHSPTISGHQQETTNLADNTKSSPVVPNYIHTGENKYIHLPLVFQFDSRKQIHCIIG